MKFIRLRQIPNKKILGSHNWPVVNQSESIFYLQYITGFIDPNVNWCGLNIYLIASLT